MKEYVVKLDVLEIGELIVQLSSYRAHASVESAKLDSALEKLSKKWDTVRKDMGI